MIRIKNINKTFNKGKLNEVKAVKEISLTFPQNGLVIIVGPSGCGKTTLLNVIGGLEYIDSGEMHIGNEIITKRNYRKLDHVRNQNIGYIFQQYNLLPNLTVHQNIEFVLKLQGITSKAEINKRIDYVLEAVGMINYKNRLIIALSGGQQQRVGIARAIAKNPEIIIADEPTGNVDSRTTIEIMNIIKKISEQKLVVLVTHEWDIAQFYGDRIIEIKDGEITNDYDNKRQKELDIRHHNTIYLKDLNQENLTNGPLEIEHFSNKDIGGKIKVTLITHNDTFYIKVDSNKKVRYIDDASDVKIINDHYKGLDQEEVKQIDFDFSQLENKQVERKRGYVFKTKDALINALVKIKGYKRLQKLMFLGFVFSAMMIAIAIGIIGKVYHVSPIDFQTVDQHYLVTNEDEYYLKNLDSIKSINPLTTTTYFTIHIKQFHQVNTSILVEAHPSDIKLLKQKNVIWGKYPENRNEVVINQDIAKALMNGSLKQAGINKYTELLDLTMGSTSLSNNSRFKIVGISDVSGPTIWMDNTYIYEMAINEDLTGQKILVSLYDDEFMELVEGRVPNTVGEILYPQQYKVINNYHLNDTIGNEFEKYTIVGFYQQVDKTYTGEVVLTTETLIKESYFKLFRNGKPLLVYSTDMDETTRYLKDKDKEAINQYEKDFAQYKKDIRQGYVTVITFAIGLLSISLLQLYFIIRSSLINKIYDIGVYRSLGATRWDIHKMFVGEVIVLTTITSLVGYTIMTLIIKEVERMTPYPFSVFYFPFHYIMGGIILIYVINIISGLYPVYRLTRKSPQQILKQHDA